MARADLVTGALLFALSAATMVGAWNMDRLEARRIHPSSAPGVTPGLLGLALAATSVILIVQAVRRQGAAGWRVAPLAILRWFDSGVRRVALALTLCLAYALGLVGRIPYWLATTLFVTIFIVVFEWGESDSFWRRLGWALGIGVATGVAVSYVFSELFLVRLP